MKKVINFANIPVRIAVSEFKYKSNHYHPDVLELLFILDGRAAVSLGQRSEFVEQGEFLVINADQLHILHSDKVCTCVSLYFDLNHYSKLLPYISGIQYNTSFHKLRKDQLDYWHELRNYFIRLMLMHNKNTKNAQTIIHDLADKIIFLLWHNFQDRKELAPQVLERYYSISTYLRNNFRGELSVTQVAQHENISVTRLAHFWKDASDLSIRQSITRLRLGEAEKLLLETPMTINDIAYQCGFSDEKYFYQHFKSHFKATPNEYRIRNLENQQQTVRVLLSRRESEQRFAAYAMKYYNAGVQPSIPGLAEEELEKENVLGHLYEAILCNPYAVVAEFETTGQDTGYMQVGPHKALFLRNNEYLLNWEYIYAQMHIFLDFGLTINMLVDFDCMPENQWEGILTVFVDELITVWGKNVVEAQNYLICSKVIPDYTKCIQLADFLKKNTPVLNARAVFML